MEHIDRSFHATVGVPNAYRHAFVLEVGVLSHQDNRFYPRCNHLPNHQLRQAL